MSDESKPDEIPPEDWVMPEPIFRTTEGHTPGSVHETLASNEIPTEPGFREAITEETLGLPPETEPVKVKAAAPKPKKRGCAKSFLVTLGLIGLAVAAVIAGLIYLLFYYKPAETGAF